MAHSTATIPAPVLGRPPLELAVDRDAELPVGVQLLWRLRGLIATGALAPGQRLPSVRELAQGSGVNVNTVRAAYAHLEDEGLVLSRQGSGTFVSERARLAGEAGQIAEDAIAAASDAGVDPRELVSAIYATAPSHAGATKAGRGRSSPTTLPGRVRERDARAARHELRRQIGRLEAELAAYAESAEAHRPRTAAGAVAHVAGIGELEATRDWLLDRLRAAQADEQRAGRRQARARRRVEDMVRDPEAHRWQWVSSEETGEPGCREYRVVPRFGPVGAAMGWWRVKVSGGCPLAAPREAAFQKRGERTR